MSKGSSGDESADQVWIDEAAPASGGRQELARSEIRQGIRVHEDGATVGDHSEIETGVVGQSVRSEERLRGVGKTEARPAVGGDGRGRPVIDRSCRPLTANPDPGERQNPNSRRFVSDDADRVLRAIEVLLDHHLPPRRVVAQCGRIRHDTDVSMGGTLSWLHHQRPAMPNSGIECELRRCADPDGRGDQRRGRFVLACHLRLAARSDEREPGPLESGCDLRLIEVLARGLSQPVAEVQHQGVGVGSSERVDVGRVQDGGIGHFVTAVAQCIGHEMSDMGSYRLAEHGCFDRDVGDRDSARLCRGFRPWRRGHRTDCTGSRRVRADVRRRAAAARGQEISLCWMQGTPVRERVETSLAYGQPDDSEGITMSMSNPGNEAAAMYGEAPVGESGYGEAPYGEVGESGYGEVGESDYGEAPYGEVGESDYGEAPYGEVGESDYGEAPYGEVGEAAYGEVGESDYGEAPYGEVGESDYGEAPYGEVGESGYGEVGESDYGEAPYGEVGESDYGEAGFPEHGHEEIDDWSDDFDELQPTLHAHGDQAITDASVNVSAAGAGSAAAGGTQTGVATGASAVAAGNDLVDSNVATGEGAVAFDGSNLGVINTGMNSGVLVDGDASGAVVGSDNTVNNLSGDGNTIGNGNVRSAIDVSGDTVIGDGNQTLQGVEDATIGFGSGDVVNLEGADIGGSGATQISFGSGSNAIQDNDTTTDNSVNGSFNDSSTTITEVVDNSVNDSGNVDERFSAEIEVDVEDSFNLDQSIDDSFDTEDSGNVDIEQTVDADDSVVHDVEIED